MKARDVVIGKLGQALISPGHLPAVGLNAEDALLATTPAGEGVYIAPDGELWRMEADVCDCGQCETLYRLVPIEGADRTARQALVDADEAWTQVLDEGGSPGDRIDIMVTSLLTWGDDTGVTIHHDGTLHPALLADPAPVGLTEAERAHVDLARSQSHDAHLVAIIDRLSAAPVDDRERADHYEAIVLKDWAEDRQRVPEGWRVEWRTEEPHGPGEGPRKIPYLAQIPMAVSPSIDPEEGP